MAYQQDFSDDEEKKAQQGGNAEQVISSESSSVSTSPGGSAPSSSAPQQKGSGYTNLSQYVDANRPQAAAMGERATQGLDQQARGLKSDIQSFQTDAAKQAQSATVQDKGVINNLSTAPSKFAEKQWQDLFKQQTAGYKGPNSAEQLAPYSQIAGKQQKLDSSVKALDTNQGRAQLAKDTFSPLDAQYTQGENLLDTFLLGTGGGAEKLQQFQKGYQDQNIAKQWQDATAGANTQFNQARATTEATKKATEQALQNSVGGLEKRFSGYGDQLRQEQAKNKQSFDSLQAQLGSTDATARQEAYKALGIDPAQGEWLRSQGYGLSNLAGQNQSRKLGDLTQDQEVADYGALLGLQGRENPLDFTKTGNSADPFKLNQKAVDASKNAMGLQTKLGDRLKDAQGQRDRQYSDALAAARGETRGLSQDQLNTFSQVFGLSPDDYLYAASKGLIGSDLVTKGSALNYGDIAGDTERQQWGQLMQDLGITGKLKLQDIQDEGGAYSIAPGLADRVTAQRAADKAKEEEAALIQKLAEEKAARTQADMLTGNVSFDDLGSTAILPTNGGPKKSKIAGDQPLLGSRFLPKF